jgi:hypothetical protein
MSASTMSTTTMSSAASSAAPMHPPKFIISALHFQGFSGYQGFGNNTACPGQNAAISLSGYLHHIGRGFLIQALKITQPDGLQFFNGQEEFTGYGNPLGDKSGYGRIAGYKSRFFGTRHYWYSPVMVI